MLIVNVFVSCRPESNPAELFELAARYVQGLANDDWVTECRRPATMLCIRQRQHGTH